MLAISLRPSSSRRMTTRRCAALRKASKKDVVQYINRLSCLLLFFVSREGRW